MSDCSGYTSADEEQRDHVNHPLHYGGKENPYEAIKVIEAWGLGFCLGNAVKYISRAGKKNKSKLVEDLEKTLWYLERERSGPVATWPAVGLIIFPVDYQPGYIVAAWGLSGNLCIALNYIAHSRLSGTSVKALDIAIEHVKKELENQADQFAGAGKLIEQQVKTGKELRR